MRSIFVSHWSIKPTMMSIHQIILKILSTRPWNTGHVDLYLFWGQNLSHTVSLSENMTHIHQIGLEIKGKLTGPWNNVTVTYIYFWGQMSGHTDLQYEIRMLIQQTVFKISCKINGPWNIGHSDLHSILRSNNRSYWVIIRNKDAHTSNSFQDIRQNHWTMKYRSHWPTFILRSNVGSYWFILSKYITVFKI